MVKRKFIKYLVIGTAALIVLILLLLATTELTSKPTFCANCHYMEPYVEGWKTSSHADVTCTKCH
ncbi:MAG: NapC/NirT family cytochrome c, partial [Candidatus Marinimicrobia bacterium]|nr:NapC/NirT family cytochrome c [Candidatus Neomarinimicrobiota bacterium]